MNDLSTRRPADSAMGCPPRRAWRGLVVDDDVGSQKAVAMALDEASVFGLPVELDFASSAAEAKVMLVAGDYAFALIDVAMERRDAGLDLVDWIRERHELAALRVAMRSGYSGALSAGEIIQKYDISDFRAKSELSSSQLLAVIASMARSWMEVGASMAGERAMAAWARGAQELAQADSAAQFLHILARSGAEVMAPWSFEALMESSPDAGLEGSGHWVRAPGLAGIRARFDGGRCWPAQEVAALRLLDSARAAYAQLASVRSLEAMAYADAVTGLANRRRLMQWLDEASREGEPLAAMILDLDHFKRVNDRLGHDAGDRLLKIVGERMRQACEAEPARAARLGGDEFCALFRCQSQKQAERSAAAWLARLAGEAQVGVDRVDPTFSAGVSWAAKPQPAELLRQADVAMYQSKTQGRARLSGYRPGMGMDAPKREREQRLAQGVAQGELVALFQPIVEASLGGSCVAFEVLARWRKPDGSLALAGDFLPMAQDGSLSRSIDVWMASRAMEASQDIGARANAHQPRRASSSRSGVCRRAGVGVVGGAPGSLRGGGSRIGRAAGFGRGQGVRHGGGGAGAGGLVG